MSTHRGWPHDPVDTGSVSPPVVDHPVALSVRDPATPVTGPAEPATRPRLLISLAALVTVAVLLSGFAVFDWISRNQELDVLLARIERAETSQLAPRDLLDPLLRDCYFSSRDCDSAAIARVATRTLPALQATGDEVAKTRLTRHHGALRDLRDRYVEHNLAWQAWLTALANGPSGDIEPPNEINTTFRIAAAAALHAVPPFALHDANSRVQDIFR